MATKSTGKQKNEGINMENFMEIGDPMAEADQ